MSRKEIGFTSPLQEASVDQLQKWLDFSGRMTKVGVALFSTGLGAAAGSPWVEEAAKGIGIPTLVGGIALMGLGIMTSSFRRVGRAVTSEVERRGLGIRRNFLSRKIDKGDH